jgi:hypothetical protein
MTLVIIISCLLTIGFLYFYKKVSVEEQSNIAFLPRYFVFIGIFILVICAVSPLFFIVFEETLDEIRSLLILIGLIIICVSKEKSESKLLDKLRLQVLIASLSILSIVYLILKLFNYKELDSTTPELFPISIMILYLFVFHLSKVTLIITKKNS